MLNIQQEFQDMLKGSDELRQEYEDNKALIDSMLKALSVYKCEQAVAKLNIHFNRITDGKNPDKVYIQARAALPFKKGKRKWIGVYLGKEEHLIDSSGKLSTYCKSIGEKIVRSKMLNTLIEELNP